MKLRTDFVKDKTDKQARLRNKRRIKYIKLKIKETLQIISQKYTGL